ncbi:MAG: hypothetical protein M0C28_38300 [Candidatus Moduliflexus flocculans]|nr:hypothetical protein [Candidatus Moduliflexus flocculans]
MSRGEAERKTVRASLAELDRLGPDWWCGYSYSLAGEHGGPGLRRGEGGSALCGRSPTASACPTASTPTATRPRAASRSMTYRPFTLEGNFAFAAGDPGDAPPEPRRDRPRLSGRAAVLEGRLVRLPEGRGGSPRFGWNAGRPDRRSQDLRGEGRHGPARESVPGRSLCRRRRSEGQRQVRRTGHRGRPASRRDAPSPVEVTGTHSALG